MKKEQKRFLLSFCALLLLVSWVGVSIIKSWQVKPTAQPTVGQQIQSYTAAQQKKPVNIEPPKLDPKIISKELEKVGQLIVFKGSLTYSEPVENKGFLWRRTIDLQLNYNYGFVFDLSKVTVEEIAPNIVSLSIPKQEIKLAYMELDATASTMNGKNSLFAPEIKPYEMRYLLEVAQTSVVNKVAKDMTIHSKSIDSLKTSLEQLVMKLEFRKVIIEEE